MTPCEPCVAPLDEPLAESPYSTWADGPLRRDALRAAITANTCAPESAAVQALLPQARCAAGDAPAIAAVAEQLVKGLRAHDHGNAQSHWVQGLLQEYTLSSSEGVALMCLAEALLRIPDAPTRDALIRDKIAAGHWREHLGHSASLFVNAATWGLVISGKLVATHPAQGLGQALSGLIRRGGEPLIRKGVDLAMRMLGRQFVTGETIELALQHARGPESLGFAYSYDMLGEAALTAADAQRYFQAYQQAIVAIGAAAQGNSVIERAGISIKLSALHPRTCRAQYRRVMDELYPRLLELALSARALNIGLNIDAEESARLELSLDLLQRLCLERQLQGYDGIGFVVQAYQKRCPAVIDWLIDLARRSGHRLMIRLVKGAYWDSEIKRAQLEGLEDYPVYTRKAHTDAAYLACARQLLAAADAVYPQFATHNAHSVAALAHMAGIDSYTRDQYEFQCLHGMGEALYTQIVSGQALGGQTRPCRIYAPVGPHDRLLAYLVRRLLENGANTSFVHRVADRSLAPGELIEDPLAAIQRQAADSTVGAPHPQIALPAALYGQGRANSRGLDLNDESTLAQLQDALAAAARGAARAVSAGDGLRQRPWTEVRNPARHDEVVGSAQWADANDAAQAVGNAAAAAAAWANMPTPLRAACLHRAASALEADAAALIDLLVREAGKTAANAVAELREAVDFLRYYAAQIVEHGFAPQTHIPLGTVACISPWNFPLAIFTGQVAAALAAGNCVVAKPAEQTPLIAARVVTHLHAAAVPAAALQLLLGEGDVGAALVADSRVQGVVFTGSTEVAKRIQSQLALRLDARGQAVTLIAETGGQNAMIVDSSALTEQVVSDAVSSAFDSAGQRCSALRVLCVQEEVADGVVTMLRGAMAELQVGDPGALSTDVGPVINRQAQTQIEQHIADMRALGCAIHTSPMNARLMRRGNFVAPTLIEIPSLACLTREVFGPVCHVLRYRRDGLDELLDAIHASGYGLTLGLHTRIDETIDRVRQRACVGNLYVNRNQVGAVVGVQPFGGEGLSGTGPKAGGPLYLYRLLAQKPSSTIDTLLEAALQEGISLPGPTGEFNHYRCVPRSAVLCLAEDDDDRRAQTQAVCAVGAVPLWPSAQRHHAECLAPSQRALLRFVDDWTQAPVAFDLVLFHGTPEAFITVQGALAGASAAVIGAWRGAPGQRDMPLERLVLERSVSINTAAAGGNASLTTLGE